MAQEIVDAVPGGEQSGAVVDADAGYPRQCQHAVSGALPIDPRHAKTRVAGKVFGQLRPGRGLEAQIHLEADHLGQGLDDFDRFQPSRRRVETLDQAGEPPEQIDVAGERLGHPRAQHFDRDLLPVEGFGKVDLGDRGGGDRGFVKRGKQGFERPTELGFDRRARQGSGKRRQPILQARQIDRDLLAQEIGAGRQQLAELDEARPHFVERRRQPLARARRRGRAAPHEPLRQAQAGGQNRDAGKREHRIVARQDQPDRRQPPQIAQAAQQPEPGSHSLRGARPSEAQRSPPSGCGT